MIADQLQRHSLQQVLFNAPPGNWTAGERGTACLPGRESQFREYFTQALNYARILDCPMVHVMSGIIPAEIERADCRNTLRNNLTWAAEQAAGDGRLVLIEPINTRDMPGYFLNRQQEAHTLVEEVGSPSLKVQMDLYHCQIAEGDVTEKLRLYLSSKATNVAHIQIASVPGRHEPDSGELNYSYLFGVLGELGYDGWIGCEYRPSADTSSGLNWIREYRLGT